MSNGAKHFTTEELNSIHQASMAILEGHGIEIKDDNVLKFFKDNGFAVSGQQIKFTEKQVLSALSTVPQSFTIRARNSGHNIEVGGEAPALSGTGGPTLLVEPNGSCRDATLDDYRKFCMLIQTSKVPQIVPHEMIHPMDIPAPTSHLDMLYLDMTMCDRALTGNTLDTTTTKDTLSMLALAFGGVEELKKSPASINIISPLSPLRFAPDQAESLMSLAEHNQAVAITNMILLGSTAPINIASALAVGNAEILAGIVLNQLVRPGAPVVYGSTSCPMDMRAGLASLGKPETLIYIQATTALARFYKVPSRAGGSLTDAHIVDSQSALESALLLKTAIDNGVDYMLHSFGMMSSYMAASLEKWVIDEEVARLILSTCPTKQQQHFDPNSIDVDYVIKMGAGGNYLGSPETFKKFRTLYQGGFLNVQAHTAWKTTGSHTAVEKATLEVEARLQAYQAPPMATGLDEELKSWVSRRKQELS